MRRFTTPTAILLGLAALKLALHLLTNGQYGFHRDELYYIVGGQQLSWGYVDHPPLVPLLAHGMISIFGLSIAGLRLAPALMGALVVFVTGLLARELGGGRLAQALAPLAVIASLIYLLTNTLFQTVTPDQLAWVLGCYLLLRLLNGADARRTWLLLGALLGVALLAKYTVVLFGLGVLVGLLLTPSRAQLRTQWPWLAAALALLIAAPNLLWQINHSFPTLEFLANNNANLSAEQSRLELLLLQIPLIGPLTFPLLLAGAYFLFSPAGKAYRLLGWLYATVMLVLLALNGKIYYPAPLYPVLFAAGAVWLERFTARRQRAWLRPTAFGATLVSGLICVVIALPVLPLQTFVQYQDSFPHNDFAEMFGWPELVQTVAEVYENLPADEQARAVIFTGNYGEASAINLLGDNLPRAISGHNSYWLWGPGAAGGDVVLVLGINRERLSTLCSSVREVGVINNKAGVDNEEAGRPLFLCRDFQLLRQGNWAEARHYE